MGNRKRRVWLAALGAVLLVMSLAPAGMMLPWWGSQDAMAWKPAWMLELDTLGVSSAEEAWKELGRRKYEGKLPAATARRLAKQAMALVKSGRARVHDTKVPVVLYSCFREALATQGVFDDAELLAYVKGYLEVAVRKGSEGNEREAMVYYGLGFNGGSSMWTFGEFDLDVIQMVYEEAGIGTSIEPQHGGAGNLGEDFIYGTPTLPIGKQGRDASLTMTCRLMQRAPGSKASEPKRVLGEWVVSVCLEEED